MRDTASIPAQKLYRAHMQRLNVVQTHNQTVLDYDCGSHTYQKRICNSQYEQMELEFEAGHTLKINLHALREILRRAQTKRIVLEIADDLVISYKGTRIVFEGGFGVEKMQFDIELDTFCRVLSLVDLFPESFIILPKEPGAICVMFRSPEVVVSSYIAG